MSIQDSLKNAAVYGAVALSILSGSGRSSAQEASPSSATTAESAVTPGFFQQVSDAVMTVTKYQSSDPSVPYPASTEAEFFLQATRLPPGHNDYFTLRQGNAEVRENLRNHGLPTNDYTVRFPTPNP